MERTVTKTQLEEYRARWQIVNELQAEELRMTSFTERWKQLNAIIRLAVGLGWHVTRDEEQIAVVRGRWQKLKGLN